MAVCAGEIRLYVFIGMFGGGVIYFLVFSTFVVRAGKAILGFTAAVLKIAVMPFVWVLKFFRFILRSIKKDLKYLKKLFQFLQKGYTISNMAGVPRRRQKELSRRDACSKRASVRYEKDEKRPVD